MLIPWPHGDAQAPHVHDSIRPHNDGKTDGDGAVPMKRSPLASCGASDGDCSCAMYDWTGPLVASQPACPGREDDRAPRGRGRGRSGGAGKHGTDGRGSGRGSCSAAQELSPRNRVCRTTTTPPQATALPCIPAIPASPRDCTAGTPSRSAALSLRLSIPKAGFAAGCPGVALRATAAPPVREKRRGGLVRRTHSPKTVPSPLSRRVKLGALTEQCPSLPITKGPLPVFPPAVSGKKKRRRSNVVSTAERSKAVFLPMKKKKRSSSKTRSPVPPPYVSKQNSSDGAGATTIKVRAVSPTVRGISEAARVLRVSTESPLAVVPTSCTENHSSVSTPTSARGIEGILSFPTETVYTLATCVRVDNFVRPASRSSSTSSASSSSSSTSTSSSENSSDGNVEAGVQSSGESLTRLLHLKGRTDKMSPTQTIGSEPDPPLLYIHAPSQYRDFVQFTKPKTFMVKKPTNDTDEERRRLPAVTFSESREVLDRLAAAFWPGPVVIYAPAKMRRFSRGSTQKSLEGSKGSSSPLKNDLIDEPGVSPFLPASALVCVPPKSGEIDSAETYYVGMRCPSHPLARRVLEGVYNRNSKTKRRGRRGRCVVLGFTASIPHSSPHGREAVEPCPTTARDVCAQLLCSPRTSTSTDAEAEVPTTVHVLNGEDKREIFSHVTCEFGAEASVSLLIDDTARSVQILRRGKDEKESHPYVHPVDVMRALLKPSPLTLTSEGGDEMSSRAANRVINAVLQRWRVVEEIVG